MLNKINKLFLRYVTYFGTLFILWKFFPPFYYKIDDVVMSMISNGFGQMDSKSNLIYHSNILIGFLGGHLPSIYGLLPYNYINIILLTISYISINETVFKRVNNLTLSYLIVLSSSFFILVRPTFSTISGYLTIAGLLNLYHAKSTKNIIGGLIFLLIATLIRDEMVFFIILFTSIIIYRLVVNNNGKLLKYLSMFIIIFIITQIINRIPYEDEDLKNLKTFANVQYQLTDYNADKYLINHEKILANNQYTVNDIKLFRNWFFTDLNLIDSSRLTKLLKESNWNGSYNNLDIEESISASIILITKYPVNIVLFAAFLIFCIANRNKDLYTLWILFGLSIIFGAIIGRQLLYIYYPLLVFLFIFSCLDVNFKKNFYKLIVALLCLSILIVNILSNISNRRDLEIAKSEYNEITLEKLWVIGGGISLPHAFPLLGRNLKSNELQLIATDWSIYSPNSNFLKFNSDNEFITQLQSPSGVNVSINNYLLPLIQIHCREKFGTDLIENKLISKQFIRIVNIKCPSNQINISSPTMEFSDGIRGFVWLTPETDHFQINNYSRIKFTSGYDLVIQNNPCNLDVEFTIESNNFKQTLSSKQEIAKLQLILEPYQNLTVYTSFPPNQEYCVTNNGDKRIFIAKLINDFR